jgi:competence protein ComGC
MLNFLRANIGTIIVIAIIILIVVLIIKNLVSDKKKGIGSCGCKCSECKAGCIYSQNDKTKK